MLTMILKMSLSTAIYIGIAALLWRLRPKRRLPARWKIAVGVIFGACSVASTHLGIDYNAMVLNVRDLGPMAAGLFFDPVSGIIAGVIGGVERFIAGTFWNIGSFTRFACSLSTLLAGFLSAVLHRWVYEGERPTVTQSFFLGAVMEVFHMYVVLISHRDDMAMAYAVVRECAVPMILFTGLGMLACSAVIRLLSHDTGKKRLIVPLQDTPVYLRFQRWLLVITAFLFMVAFWIAYAFQTNRAYQDAAMNLEYLVYTRSAYYEGGGDLHTLELMMNETDVTYPTFYILWEKDGKTIHSNSLYAGLPSLPADQALVQDHLDEVPFVCRLECMGGEELLCTASRLGEYYLLLALPTDSIYENRTNNLYENVLSDFLIFTVLYILIAVMVDKLVVRRLDSVNKSLHRITSGHLEEVVDVRSSSEFSMLSDDINETVTALRGYIDAAEKRMEEELRLASTIQEAALPRVFTFPREDFSIYALMTPARHVGGDFYDFFFISRNHFALVIADVSGKGVPAALFMMRAKTAIKNFARSGNTPASLLSSVNKTLCEGNDAEMFVSVWIGIIDLNTGIMNCANAGHEYPVLMRAGGEYELLKDKHGLVLAAMDSLPLRDYELRMNPGDRLFVYTDGVPEAINEAKEQYGTDRLTAKLNTLRESTEEETLNAVLEDIRGFADGVEQFDDITMIGFTYLGPDQNSPA